MLDPSLVFIIYCILTLNLIEVKFFILLSISSISIELLFLLNQHLNILTILKYLNMLLSRTERIFNKVMTTYRRGHIINILETFDQEHLEYGKNVPLDMHIRKYYLSNRQVSNIDREFINDQVYNLIRYKGLLDFLTRKPLNWHSRFDRLYEPDFTKQMDNVNLPP